MVCGPTPYLEVAAALPRLKEKYLLAALSNGTPRMLRTDLERTGLRPHFYKPLSKVYQLAPNHKRLPKSESRFVSSSSFNVMGAINFGFRVCRINRTSAPLDPLGPKPDLVVKSLDDLVGAL